MRKHLVIPDTQAKEGVPEDHLYWISQYIVEKKPDVIVHLGDHADMPSLSSYDEGKRSFEGRRYKKDIEAANGAFDKLNSFVNSYNHERRRLKERQYKPEKHITLGNHEYRIERAVENDAKLEGVIGVEDLNYAEHGYEVHPFREVVDIDGVWYSHYFYNPMSGHPWGGMIETRLKNVGHSFTQGHAQTLLHGIRYVGDKPQHGLVCGACYLHDEDYKGPQGNHHWRGIIVKHEVREGAYDPMFVSLGYLCRRYEGMSLKKFMRKVYPVAA